MQGSTSSDSARSPQMPPQLRTPERPTQQDTGATAMSPLSVAVPRTPRKAQKIEPSFRGAAIKGDGIRLKNFFYREADDNTEEVFNRVPTLIADCLPAEERIAQVRLPLISLQTVLMITGIVLLDRSWI